MDKWQVEEWQMTNGKWEMTWEDPYCNKPKIIAWYYPQPFYIFRILILLAQIHLDIGDDLEAERYLEKARPICDELNESLMMGLYFDCQAKLSENKNANVIAIENYNKSIGRGEDIWWIP